MRFVWLAFWLLWTGAALAESSLPYEKDIHAIIDPLQYSGFPDLTKPQVTLSVDFRQGLWTLHNIHIYDDRGDIILQEGRFGLCAELATYVFEKLKPLLSPQYELRFAMATESGFFAAPQSNHIVLLMVDKLKNQVHLIDPSFRIYGKLHDFKDYQILNIQDSISFIKDKSADVFFNANQAMPLYIKNDILLSFSMTSVDGKFDKENFMFAVSATRRFKFAGRDILVIGRRHNEFEDFEDRPLLGQLLTAEEQKILFDKLKMWLSAV